MFISQNLGGRPGDAGLIVGLCAALEIPLMLGLGLLSARLPLRTLILAGAACGLGYQALATLVSTIWVLAAGQVLCALSIAAVGGLGISYMQDLLPAHPGRATTMFVNTFPIGQILSGPLFGVAAHVDYRLAYAMNLALSVLGLALLAFARPTLTAQPATP